MILAEFESLLKLTMGLDAASIGSSAVERAVRQRLANGNFADAASYWKYLMTSEEELQELVEAIVVPETWFFRDREAFATLVQFAREASLPKQIHGALRLLSLPCSTGEEPYSMAMALIDAGIAPSRFHIDAIDISTRALEHAGRAKYGKNSFRGNTLDFRERHFLQTHDGYQLVAPVIRQVTFNRGNLFDDRFLAQPGAYDVIFCRNLLIYFDSAAQSEAVGVLGRLLSPGGCLFVGSSEGGLLLNHDFVPVRAPLSFAFRRSRPVPAAPKKAGSASQQLRQGPRRLRVDLAKPKAPDPLPQSAPTPEIAAIRSIADAGHLAEAARHCEAYLKNDRESVEAWHLLAVIRDAAGNREEAVKLYRKALYLDPRHAESLAHLSLLLEHQGDVAGAKVLSNRLQRLDQRKQA